VKGILEQQLGTGRKMKQGVQLWEGHLRDDEMEMGLEACDIERLKLLRSVHRGM
jgi:hypothetical protein